MLFSIKFTNTCPISPGDYTASPGGSQVKLDDKSVTFLKTKVKANKDMCVDTQSADQRIVRKIHILSFSAFVSLPIYNTKRIYRNLNFGKV